MKLQCVELLSSFAFNLNSRRYIQGPPGSDARCTLTAVNSTYHTCTCPYRAIFKSDNFTQQFPEFLAAGIRGAVSDALTTLKPDGRTITSSRSVFYVNDVFDLKQRTKHMKEARSVISDSRLVKEKGARAFAFDYGLYARNEQYISIEVGRCRLTL